MMEEKAVCLTGGVTWTEYSDPEMLVQSPLVSVKMITYNHGPYIAEAIESIMAQDVDFPFELVIGEDCSTDGTRETVFEHLKRNPEQIRVVTSDHNVGMLENGKRADRSLRGKYLAFCEGDDYWHDPLKLQKQVAILEEEPECVLVHTDIDMLYQDRQIRVSRFNRRRGYQFDQDCSLSERFERLLCGEDTVYTPTVCLRRQMYHEVILSDPRVFQDSYFPMGDTPRWLELARKGRFRYVDESTATFRRLSDSACRGKDLARLARFSQKSIELRQYYRRKYRCDEDRFRKGIRLAGTVGLRRSCLAGDPDVARQIKDQLPKLTPGQRVLYVCARHAGLSWAYRWIDRVLIYLRRIYRRLRYGIESSV